MMLITISLVLSLFQQSLASTAFCQNKDYESGALGDFPSQLYNAAPFHPVQLNYALPPAKCPSNDDIDGYFFLSPGSIDTLQEDTSIINADGTLVGSIPGLFMGMHKYNGTNHIATWTGTHEPVNNAYGSGYITLLDDTYSMVANFTTVNLGVGADIHEVEITSSSTAIMVAYLPRRTDLQAYGGPMNGYLADSIVQEVDIATGRLSFSWNALEHVDPSDCYAAFGSTGNGSVEYPWDYFHINSVQKQPDGNYLISSRHCQAVYLIDPSGTIIWQMGGKKSDFVFPQGLEFSWQHHARIHNRSTLSLFNNGASEWQEDLPFAQGLLLKFDYSNTNKEVSAINARNPFSPKPSMFRGSVQLLESGESIVGWGNMPYFSHHDVNGNIKWSAQFALPCAESIGAYRVFLHKWVGRPTYRPSMQISNTSTMTNVTAYAWWNGATEVTAWKLLGSKASPPQTMTLLNVVRRVDFETALNHCGDEGYRIFLVAAVNAHGEVLAYSDSFLLDGQQGAAQIGSPIFRILIRLLDAILLFWVR